MYKYFYQTKDDIDDIVLTSDGEALTGLWFVGSFDETKHESTYEEKALPIFLETKKWLDSYFKGEEPIFTPKYKLNGTSFKEEVWHILENIPYGQVITYGEIAAMIAKKRGLKKMSSRAVGGAIGKNPICIIIPCHRVVGINNNLTGYGGGINNKIALLRYEGVDTRKYKKPKGGKYAEV